MLHPISISSITDPRLEVFRDVRDRDLRGRARLFMAESEMVLRRLLERPECLHSLLLSPAKLEALRSALAVLPASVPVYTAGVEVMTQIAGFHIHRGVLAAGHRPAARELTLDAALGHLAGRERITMLAAEGLTNVDNIGALFRNAAAFGVDGIALDPRCCDPLYRKAVRVSMGHVLSVPYAVCASWPEDLRRLRREWGLTVVGAEASAGATPVREMPRAERMVVLLGSEGHGLTREALAACEAVCRIPMSPAVPSINVATAAAVFLYERRRGEGRTPPGDARAGRSVVMVGRGQRSDA